MKKMFVILLILGSSFQAAARTLDCDINGLQSDATAIVGGGETIVGECKDIVTSESFQMRISGFDAGFSIIKDISRVTVSCSGDGDPRGNYKFLKAQVSVLGGTLPVVLPFSFGGCSVSDMELEGLIQFIVGVFTLSIR